MIPSDIKLYIRVYPIHLDIAPLKELLGYEIVYPEGEEFIMIEITHEEHTFLQMRHSNDFAYERHETFWLIDTCYNSAAEVTRLKDLRR